MRGVPYQRALSPPSGSSRLLDQAVVGLARPAISCDNDMDAMCTHSSGSVCDAAATRVDVPRVRAVVLQLINRAEP
jgi:hypothetical protein